MAQGSPTTPLQHNLRIIQVHVPLAIGDLRSPSWEPFCSEHPAQLLLRPPATPLAPGPPGLDPHPFLHTEDALVLPLVFPLFTFPKALTSQKHLSGICQ